MGEAEKVKLDAKLYGTGFMRDGKRIDPRDVYLQPPTEAERLADILDGMANGQPWRLSQQKDYGEAAALIRAQSARIAALEDALRDIKEYADAIPREEYCYQVASDALDGGYVSEAKAFEAFVETWQRRRINRETDELTK